MTTPMEKNSRRLSVLTKPLGLMLLAFTAACTTNTEVPMDRTMQNPIPTPTLWQVLAELMHSAPLSQLAVEKVLQQKLQETRRNEYTTSFQAEHAIPLQQDLQITAVDLRQSLEKSTPAFLALHLGGGCVTLAQVREHFGQLTLAQVPRGRSFDETTAYNTSYAWGTLWFSFKVSRPDCLATIALHPKPKS